MEAIAPIGIEARKPLDDSARARKSCGAFGAHLGVAVAPGAGCADHASVALCGFVVDVSCGIRGRGLTEVRCPHAYPCFGAEIEPMESAATTQASKQRPRGRPFAPGVSGNPRGDVMKTIRARAAELRATIVTDDLKGALSAIDNVLLDRAVLLLAKSERLHMTKHVDAGIRMTSEARRILQSLRRRHATAPTSPAEPFTDISARAQAEAAQRRALELAADEAPVAETLTTGLPKGNGGHCE
jgi:hypothetical protein